VVFLGAAAAQAQPVTPFHTFNQSPIIQLHGLPAIDSAGILARGRARYQLVQDLASNYTFKATANETLLFDGEVGRTTFVYARGFGEGMEWALHIPYVNYDPGGLDSFIEDWHDFFNLPQGGRDIAPHDQLNFFYERNGVTELSLTERSAGIGDVRLSAGWQWPATRRDTRIALRGQLSLPTGDSDQLRGSGSTDVALWAVADRRGDWFGYPSGVFGGGGLLVMGDGEILADQQRRTVLFGSLGTGARVLPWLTLKLQADFHSALYQDSSLEQIESNAVQFSMGGDLQLYKHVRLDIAVKEDPTVHASPDVVFHFNLVVQ
jgi:hypothetical protein